MIKSCKQCGQTFEITDDDLKFYEEEILKKNHRASIIINSENVSGNYIVESKDIFNCFDIEKVESASNSWGVEYSRDIYDCDYIYYGEKCYENISNSHSMNIYFSFVVFESNDILYSMYCFNNTQNCFGSISLNKQKNCILNKPYEKNEYDTLQKKIIEHMKKNNEWGEFFPLHMSYFAYNESVSQEYFPLTKAEALQKELTWKDEDTKQYKLQIYTIPDDIKDVSESLTKEILVCKKCKKNYKIIPQEFQFYKQIDVSIPHNCPECRYNDRIKLRNPKKLWKRQCSKCRKNIKTSYAPERPETVYCEECYLKEVY